MIKYLLTITQWLKSKLSLYTLVLLLPVYTNAQACFEVKHKWNADILIYVTPNKYDADNIIYYSKSKASLRTNIVYWTKYKWEAEYKVFFVKHKWESDSQWYITKYRWETSDEDKKWVGDNGIEFYD
mgnify:FL=1